MVFDYPQIRRDESIKETLHNIEVCDVYQYLEDPDSEETKLFVEKQNQLTMSFINECPYKSKINSRLTEMSNFPKYECPLISGKNYFFKKNSGLQNQSVLYKQTSLDSEPDVFFDPNALNADGTTSLTAYSFSEDGQWFAYGLSDAGSDWVKIKIRNVETGEDCDEILERCKTAISWTHDNLGF
ncbi:Prolyl endopeptidase-like protein, partial [Leptotrombidium deliense]